MKSPTTPKHSVTVGVDQIRAFSIKANAKAFRTLIDGIYSNKVLAPVRELMTNAFDAHVAAGNESTPFVVGMPSRALPEFSVRDFGIGMDHEQVMDSYSTLFESTKDHSNEAVGMLGLGSKSPFAYTDAFTLSCFDGQTRRMYSAHMSQDMPQIALMSTVPSDEPRGVEVKFGVQPQDVINFSRAISRCLPGFDVQPLIEGEPPESQWESITFHEGDGYRVVEHQNVGWGSSAPTGVYIRMGCVLYPAPFDAAGGVQTTHSVQFIVDVPIGTADITTNREALSDDSVSVNALTSYIQAAWEDFKSHMSSEFKAASNQLEKAQAALKVPKEWRTAVGVPHSPTVSVTPGKHFNNTEDIIKNGVYVKKAGWRQRDPLQIAYIFHYSDIKDGRISFVLDDPEAKRRMRRLKSHLADDNHRYFIPEELKATVIPILKDECGVPEDSFIEFDDVYDPGPPERKTVSSRKGIKTLREELNTDKYWMIRMRGKVQIVRYSDGGVLYPLDMIREVPKAAAFIGLDDDTKLEDKLVYLTEAEAKKLDAPEERNLARALRPLVETVSDSILAFRTARAVKKEASERFEQTALMKIMTAEGYMIQFPEEERLLLQRAMGFNYMEDFKPELKPDHKEVVKQVEALKKKYPRLVKMTHSETNEYINNINQEEEA